MSTAPTGLALYDRTAGAAAAAVISAYSTSFSLASRLLGSRVRGHVRNVYALVRVADEVVDGPAAAAGLPPAGTRALLDELESETLGALRRGFSTNLVVHAFALTARECGIGPELVDPFFAAMRTDLDIRRHDAASHDVYVYGSAEVVGLMCLRVFLGAGCRVDTDPAAAALLTDGARRLGAAFQDVNFLRDLPDDADRLGRDYLGVADAAGRTAVLDRIDADLATARTAIPLLPEDCRRAVTAAHDLFAALSARLRRTDDDRRRVSVPAALKAVLAGRAALGLPPRRVRR